MAEEAGLDDAALGAIARHALHDEELIAAFAADDVEDAGDVSRARSLLERCPTCREIHADLTAIRTAIRASGSAEQRAATLTAPRDFRLTLDDAARLRPGAPVARLARRLGLRARLGLAVVAFGRPAGAALATFGIAGLLLGSATLGSGLRASLDSNAGAAPSHVPGVTEYQQGPQATQGSGVLNPLSTPKSDNGGAGGARDGDALESRPLSILLIGGGAAAVVLGVALVVAARRPRAAANGA